MKEEELEDKPQKSKKEMTYEEKMALKRAKKTKEEVKEEPEAAEEEEVYDEEEDLEMETEEPEEQVEEVIEADSTVFVKNLSFKTTDAMLEEVFG